MLARLLIVATVFLLAPPQADALTRAQLNNHYSQAVEDVPVRSWYSWESWWNQSNGSEYGGYWEAGNQIWLGPYVARRLRYIVNNHSVPHRGRWTYAYAVFVLAHEAGHAHDDDVSSHLVQEQQADEWAAAHYRRAARELGLGPWYSRMLARLAQTHRGGFGYNPPISTWP